MEKNHQNMRQVGVQGPGMCAPQLKGGLTMAWKPALRNRNRRKDETPTAAEATAVAFPSGKLVPRVR